MGYRKKNIDRASFVEVALERGWVQGRSILVIDLNLCTRCDECVRACAATHGGRPRFIREGDRHENWLVTRACYHCQDPACLVGCPTGAIQRRGYGQLVKIDEKLCIGCQVCARNCPFDAITMVDLQAVWPDTALPQYLRGQPKMLASKCDLCDASGHGPACVYHCPNGCAYRVSSPEQFQQLMSA
ncbi:MAG: 4Fe-4S dicluster domain-containing protein [Calditrichaeota bacterium]|nr:MAG: 4Fe-4S dicluster domain-containing protein [Calditrichota bacterium]